MATDSKVQGEPDVPGYRPITPKRRLAILALAVATALFVMYLLLERPGGLHGPKAKPSAASAPVEPFRPILVIPAQPRAASAGG